jgi:phospholipase D1/2
VAVIVALAAAWRWTPLAELATAERILGWTRAVRDTWWAPLALIGSYTVCAFLLFPRPVITLVSVITFGVWLGLAYSTAGVLLAALVTYGVGRFLPRAIVRRLAGDSLDAAAKPVKKHGVIAMFAANMMPTPPFVVQNIIAGAIRIRLWEFMAGTFLAMLPGMLAWTVFGEQIRSALDDASNVSYWLIGAALVLLVVFVLGTRYWLRRKGY